MLSEYVPIGLAFSTNAKHIGYPNSTNWYQLAA